MLLLALVACGPDPADLAAAAVADAGIDAPGVEGAGGAWTFEGTRHGLPCRGSVRVQDDVATVAADRCPPAEAGSASLALYTHLVAEGLDELVLTGGPQRWVIRAAGCSGSATRNPGGALSGEVRCGTDRKTFAGVFPDRPRNEAERGELHDHLRNLASAAGLLDAIVEGDTVRGTLRGEPCETQVDLTQPVEALDLARCPGFGPPPQALRSRATWLAWMLDVDGFTDVIVGPKDKVVATLGNDRLQGTATFKGASATVSLGGGERAVVRLLSVPETLR